MERKEIIRKCKDKEKQNNGKVKKRKIKGQEITGIQHDAHTKIMINTYETQMNGNNDDTNVRKTKYDEHQRDGKTTGRKHKWKETQNGGHNDDTKI